MYMRVHHTSASPLPTSPPSTFSNAPSKSAPAFQGLSRALVDAEVVDPDMILPVPLEGADDGGSCLSEKMRKRLHESGITELFAGVLVIIYLPQYFLDLLQVQTALLPFLIASRQLYLPHHPIQDVCVSAPTGSGKTLAYVLPIIEVITL